VRKWLTQVHECSACERLNEYVHKECIISLMITGGLSVSQETEGQKTNNGIQYRLQLRYANGK
jgi:hypothetical protein